MKLGTEEGETWPEALDVLVVLGPPEAETRLVLARVPPARRVAIFQRELDAKWPLAVTARKRVAPYPALCDDPGIRAPLA